MDEMERESGITEEFAEQKKEHKALGKVMRTLGRLIALIVTIALVVGAVWLVAHWDEINVDAIRRAIAYRTGDASVAQQIIYSGDANGSFVGLSDGLLTCSERELQLYDKGGQAVIDEVIDFDKPILCVEGDYALAYDAGGTRLFLIHNERISWDYTAAPGRSVLSARCNADGWVTLVEQASGYKASVTVYNAGHQPVVTVNISSSFITDAVLSPDGKQLALVSIGEAAAGFDSTLIFYQVSDGQEIARCDLGSDVLLDLQWEKDGLWVCGEYGAYRINDAVVEGQYTDPSWYLRGFSLGGEDFAALFYSKYQSGTTGTLVMLYEDGTCADLDLNEEVLSISAKGDYLAVLTASELTVYQPDLTVYAQADNDWGAKKVIMREDGSALLVSTESANLFLPE